MREARGEEKGEKRQVDRHQEGEKEAGRHGDKETRRRTGETITRKKTKGKRGEAVGQNGKGEID